MRLSVGKVIDDNFRLTQITNPELLNATNSTVVIYLDKETNDRLVDYYRGVKAVLRNNNNQLLLLLGAEESNITQAIVNLCLQYECYSIYKEVPGVQLTKEYCDELLQRKPTRREVEMYVNRSSVAVDSLDDMLLEIKQLCAEGRIDELREYVANNQTLIDELPGVMAELKSLLDPTTKIRQDDLDRVNDELQKARAELDKSLKNTARLSEQLRDKEVVTSQLRQENETLQGQVKSYAEKFSTASEKAKELELDNKHLRETLDKGDSVSINFYNTIRIGTIPGCKAKAVLYFKEVGRPKYFNSFIKYLVMAMQKAVTHQGRGKSSGKVKVMIYDSRKDFSSIYSGLHVFSEENYFSEKLDAESRDTTVFMDVNPTYLADMLTSGGYEYFVIIDRLGQKNDLLDGPNVSKFFTFSSAKEYLSYIKANGKIGNPSIIPESNNTQDNTIELRRIADYQPTTDAAAFAKWFKLINPSTGNGVFDDVLTKVGLKIGR